MIVNGLSYKHLSRVTGISEAAIGTYVRGEREPSHKTLVRIADYFKVTVDCLLRESLSPDIRDGGSVAVDVAKRCELPEKEALFLAKYLSMPAEKRAKFTSLANEITELISTK